MIENCILKSAEIEFEDHGFMVLNVIFEGESWVQGAPGLVLGYEDRGPSELLGKFIYAYMKVFDANRFSGLRGTHCRMYRESAGGPICAVEHYVKDRWLSVKGGTSTAEVVTWEELTNANGR